MTLITRIVQEDNSEGIPTKLIATLSEQEIVRITPYRNVTLRAFNKLFQPLEIHYRPEKTEEGEPHNSFFFFGDLRGEKTKIIGMPFLLTEYLPYGKGQSGTTGIVVPNKQFLLVTFPQAPQEFSFDRSDERWNI
jgi:hypothetical protein